MKNSTVPDYFRSPLRPMEHFISFLIGFACGAVVLFVFYRLAAVSAAGGVFAGFGNIVFGSRRAIKKRKTKLRAQFFDLLEAM